MKRQTNKKQSIVPMAARWGILFLLVFLCLCTRFYRFAYQAAAIAALCLICFILFISRQALIRSDAAVFVLFFVLLLALLIYCCICYGINHSTYEKHDVDRNIYKNKKILVMIPHEDDEINLCGGMYELIKDSNEVYVMFSTNGDKISDGETRIREAVNSLNVMGIDRDHIIFLGYGDGVEIDGVHMYNLPGDEVFISTPGRTRTYAGNGFLPYKDSEYTRDNMKNDIKSLILEIRPDVIFCVDYDSHQDHRALSLLFEEAMGDILKENKGEYTPAVFKGFAYSSAFWAAFDFYADNIISTVRYSADYPYPGTDYMGENNIYLWSDRVRFPVAENGLSHTLHASNQFKAMREHESQENILHAMNHMVEIINGDRVFWIRDTSSLLYDAQIDASSGDPSVLTDFKLTDSSDVHDKERKPFENLWSPDSSDEEKAVTFTFERPVDLDSVRLYDNPSLEDNILEAQIVFSDRTEITTYSLPENGTAAVINFAEKKNITSFTVRILKFEGENFGLSEVEAYYAYDPLAFIPEIIKLTDDDGNFVYDYTVSDHPVILSVYDSVSPRSNSSEFKLEIMRGDCLINNTGRDTFEISCPKRGKAVLALYKEGNDRPSDMITVRNPSQLQRTWIKLLVDLEQKYYGKPVFYTVSDQIRYFKGVFQKLQG